MTKWWDGCVLSNEEETGTVKIMFLHPNGPSLSYMYPTRLDILQVPRQDIVMKVDLCTATGRTYTLRAVENGKVNHASLHKYIRLVSDY
jgi:hypothetical protein